MTPSYSEGPLTRADFDLFWEQGFLVIEGVLDPAEVKRFGGQVLDLLPRDMRIPEHWHVWDGRIKPYYTPGNQTFDSPDFIPLWQNPTLYEVMAQLHGSRRLRIRDGSIGITLRNDRPHDGPLSQSVHLDAAVPRDADNFLFTDQEVEIGGCYYFTDVEPGGGGIHVAPGGPRQVEEEAGAVPNGRQLHNQWRDIRHMKTVEVTARAGDFVLMHHLMPHAASHNTRPATRLAQFFRYRRDDQPYAWGERPGDAPKNWTFNDLQLQAMSPLGRKLFGIDRW